MIYDISIKRVGEYWDISLRSNGEKVAQIVSNEELPEIMHVLGQWVELDIISTGAQE